MMAKNLKIKGFSMVEALVAITVLTIGVVGPLSLLANSITNANYAKNQITAFFLAQEGQEAVINARNNNRLAGKISPIPDSLTDNDDVTISDYWLSGNGLRKCIPGGTYDVCRIDASSSDGNSKLTGCEGNNCPPLMIKEDGFYGYDNGVNSIFTRTIEVVPINEGGLVDQARVTVTINWQEKGLSRKFVLESIIYR